MAGSEKTGVGIDIGKGAWACVEVAVSGEIHLGGVRARRIPFDANLLELTPLAGTIIIDIPIGLLEDAHASVTGKGRSGDREVDKGARKWCPSTSSVFPGPTRLQFASALQEHRRAETAIGVLDRKRKLANVVPGGMSQQSLELVPGIEAARKLKEQLPDQVFEAHPEVAFSALARGVLPVKKTTLLGGFARAGILRERVAFDVVSWATGQESSTRVAADNWLDALAMAIVARDWTLGRRKVLRTPDGTVHAWDGEADGIMALPSTDLTGPPPRLTSEEAMGFAHPGAGAARSSTT